MEEAFKPELPARLAIGMHIRQVHRSLVGEALASSTVISEEQKLEYPPFFEINNEGYHVDLSEAPPIIDMARLNESAVPGKILGSDSIFILQISDGSEGQDGSVEGLIVFLLKDGQRFKQAYEVITSPDTPPVLVEFNDLYGEGYSPEMSLIDRLMSLRASSPEKIHELSDDECEALMVAVNNFHVDMEDFELLTHDSTIHDHDN